MEQQKTNYGNWISLTLLRILYGTSAVLYCCFSHFPSCGPDWWL